MTKSELNRRDFTKLTVAAFGGIMAGTMTGCGKGEETASDTADTGASTGPAAGSPDAAVAKTELLLQEPHVCRGLNSCKNQGTSKDNACAGQGACATADKHSCHGENACKGQGGCGATAGMNACKSQGECGVPLKDDAWTKAREAFEKEMTAGDKTVGAAPAKA